MRLVLRSSWPILLIRKCEMQKLVSSVSIPVVFRFWRVRVLIASALFKGVMLINLLLVSFLHFFCEE